MFNAIFIYITGTSNKGSRSSRGNGKKEDQLVSQSLIYQAGETANLPCDTSVPQNHAPNDELMLIMWYREDVRSPIELSFYICTTIKTLFEPLHINIQKDLIWFRFENVNAGPTERFLRLVGTRIFRKINFIKQGQNY